MNPVGGLVASSPEPVALDEGLDEDGSKGEFLPPVVLSGKEEGTRHRNR